MLINTNFGLLKRWGIIFCLSLFLTGFGLSRATLAAPDSRYDSGMNLPFNEKAGNVNPQTGNLTVEITDLELPGRAGMDFRFTRYWNLNQSNVFKIFQSDIDGSNELNADTLERYNRLGVGWSSNIPYLSKDNSSGTQRIYLSYQGSVYELDQSGLSLYKSRINPDKSNILWYDLLDLRVYQETGIKYGDFDGFTAMAAKYNLADTAEIQNEYVLILKDNSRYWFRPDGKLMMQQDRTGLNRIWYFYDHESQLKLVVDTAGREIRFGYDAAGNLIAIEWEIEKGIKETNQERKRITETRRISYRYQSVEPMPNINNLKDVAVTYREPFMLACVVDPRGNQTGYGYQEGTAFFSFDSLKELSQNVYLLLTEITGMQEADRYKYKQCFEYEAPPQGLYSKKFYNGFIEYYKISRQYFKDRHGRIINDTNYAYHDQNETGNANQYTAVIKQGNVKTTYVYTISEEPSQDNVLDKTITETKDGFIEEHDFVYNQNRAKILDEAYRGQFVYREKYDYDLKGNLKWRQDKIGLVTITEYDEKYSLPRRITKKIGTTQDQEIEYQINNLGQIEKEIIYLTQTNGTRKAIVNAQNQYDQYGNLIKVTDAAGNSVHMIYDAAKVFLVKTYQEVTIATWQNGGIVGDNWFNEPDGTKEIQVRNWKVYNGDGSVWIEIDNDGYAIEHYYDQNRTEIETIIPDRDDLRSFAASQTDFDDFLTSPGYGAFLASRQNNPGIRRQISYTDDFVKTFTDLDISKGAVKVTGAQGDGLGHTETEIEYDNAGNAYAVKRMDYDLQGRMVALTDPDAGSNSYNYSVNGVKVPKHDKTWIIEYDDLGRKLWVTYPETEPGRTDTKKYTYNDKENSVTITDTLGRKIYEKRDWNNNLTKTVNYGDLTTRSEAIQEYQWEYDQLNRLVAKTDPQNQIVRYHYDERNLLLQENYGPSGSEFMEYNDLGLLVKKTDRKGQIIVMAYDEMRRNTGVIHYKTNTDYQKGNAVRRVETVYDNRGNPVRVSSENLIEYYLYDHNNRVVKLERRLKEPALRQKVSTVWAGTPDTQKFGFSYTYNDAGMVTKMVYPDGSEHNYEYDNTLGRLERINAAGNDNTLRPFVTGLEYTRSGVVTKMDYANQTSQSWSFDNRKRIARIQINGPNGILEDLKYKLNTAGDILAINENEYSYDGFGRISGAKTLLPNSVDQTKLIAEHFGAYQGGDPINGSEYAPEADLNNDGRINGADHILASLTNDETTYDLESFEYDKNGNRTKLIQNGDTYTYQYGDQNKLEAVYLKKKEETTPKLYLKYAYDANGNTIERIAYTAMGEEKTVFEYDTLNRVIETDESGMITQYLYDNAGNRFLKDTPGGITLYLRHGQTAVAMDIEVPETVTDIRGKVNRYVLSGDLLAGRITRAVKADGTEAVDVSYYHLDHLNSTKCVSDEAGAVEVRYIYRAFGAQLAKIGSGDAKYTYGGKELDDETNLYYFNARYYDAEIGRFISVDPAQDGWNWYVYANNNPLRFVDPTGLYTKTQQINQFYEINGTMNFSQAMKFTGSFLPSNSNKEIIKEAVNLVVTTGADAAVPGLGTTLSVAQSANNINYKNEVAGVNQLQNFLSNPSNTKKVISGEYKINTSTEYCQTIINTYMDSAWTNGRGAQPYTTNFQRTIGDTKISITNSVGENVFNPITIGSAGAPNVLVNSTLVDTKYLGANEGVPNKTKAIKDEKNRSN